VIVKYTWAGDADADGLITIDDYLAIDYGYRHGLSGWAYGDFNGDGVINAADYAIIDASFMHQSGRLAEGMIAAHAAEFGDAYTLALAGDLAVPEPATLSVLGLGVLALVRRRRGRG